MSDAYCTDCKRETELVVDHSAGDTLCSECGLVLESHSIDETSEWRTFANESSNSDPNRVGGPTNPLLADSALTTVIAKTNGSSGDFLSNSLGRWQNRNGSAERGLIQAFKTIATMSDRLGLVGTIKDRANEIFKRLEDQKSTRGRNQDALLAACLYISCRQEDKPRTIKEICSVANGATKKEIGRAKDFIVKTLGLETGHSVELGAIHAGDFMKRFCSNLGMSHQAVRAAEEAVKKSEEFDIRRSPISIAAVVIYIITQLSDDKKPLKDIAVATGVAEGKKKKKKKKKRRMWAEIICGLVIYKLVRRFFHDDEISDDDTFGSTALFSVAHRLEKLYGGKAYVGLRIPDADTSSRQDIDLVLLTKGQVVVIGVKNLSGIVTVTSDGSWVCEAGKHHTTQTYPDPLVDVKKQASVLVSYLEQRGVTLLEGNLSCKVVIPNPNFRTTHAFPSEEVITYEEWKHLKPVSRSTLSGWVKGAFCTGKEMHESSHQKLNFILATAPMWDRVELKGSKIVLGEFLEFKGKQEDTLALKQIKRSKVDRISIQQTSMLGFAPSRLQVRYSYRDYRSEGRSGSESKEVTVRSSTEVLFQPRDSTKIKKFKLSSLLSISLSA